MATTRRLRPISGGLGLSVVVVGTLLAAAKGVVGATTVTMGLIVLPTMLRHGYDKALAADLGRARPIGCCRRHAARGRQGRGRRDDGHHGPDRAADHAAPWLRQGACGRSRAGSAYRLLSSARCSRPPRAWSARRRSPWA